MASPDRSEAQGKTRGTQSIRVTDGESLLTTRQGIKVHGAGISARLPTESGFQVEQDRLESEGAWKLVAVSGEMQPLPSSLPETRFRTSVLRVLSPQIQSRPRNWIRIF